MIQEFQIRVLPEQAANEQSLKQFIGHDKGLIYVPSMPFAS